DAIFLEMVELGVADAELAAWANLLSRARREMQPIELVELLEHYARAAHRCGQRGLAQTVIAEALTIAHASAGMLTSPVKAGAATGFRLEPSARWRQNLPRPVALTFPSSRQAVLPHAKSARASHDRRWEPAIESERPCARRDFRSYYWRQTVTALFQPLHAL